jgi:hypothetical protein
LRHVRVSAVFVTCCRVSGHTKLLDGSKGREDGTEIVLAEWDGKLIHVKVGIGNGRVRETGKDAEVVNSAVVAAQRAVLAVLAAVHSTAVVRTVHVKMRGRGKRAAVVALLELDLIQCAVDGMQLLQQTLCTVTALLLLLLQDV